MKDCRLTDQCPCGGHQVYSDCCRKFHDGQVAPDAESLMRSRYCAYVLKLEQYLLQTWHLSTRPDSLDLIGGTATKWMKLDVHRHAITGADSALVEFVAHFKVNGRAQRLEESSRFVREGNQWFYLDGHIQGQVEPHTRMIGQ